VRTLCHCVQGAAEPLDPVLDPAPAARARVERHDVAAAGALAAQQRAVRKYPSAVRIDLRVLARNAATLRQLVPAHTRMCAVLKNNAFGHGSGPVARAVAPYVDAVAITDNVEAEAVRAAGVQLPLLRVRCACPDEVASSVVDVEEVVGSLEVARLLSAIGLARGRPIRVHVFLNIGENRMSFQVPGELGDVAALAQLSGVHVVGIMGHFACADDVPVTRQQLRHFTAAADSVEAALAGASTAAGGPRRRLVRHVANTQATVTLPETHLDMVRIGGGFFGQEANVKPLGLQPAFTWTTSVALVRRLPKGSALGYGMAYTARADMVVATLPVGYGNGYPKTLCGSDDAWAAHGEVVVNGVRCPIVGRISSAVITVDVTHVAAATGRSVAVGDPAVLMGDVVTAEDLASKLHTSFDNLTSTVLAADFEYVE
jgi:alanine racemase